MRSLKCLVVEDDEKWQRSFTVALAQRRFTAEDIKVAADKSQAIVALESWDPDLVILDLGIESSRGQGNTDRRHGREVLKRIGELNRQRSFRIMALIISGLMDDYDQQQFESTPWVVRAINKADVSDALPNIIKRAQKLCLPVYRDLKNHWPEMYTKFERMMNDQTSSADALFAAYDIASGVLENLGQKIMGASYPFKPTDDDMFKSIEILRGSDNKLDPRFPLVAVAPACWIAGVVYEDFHTIRRYCNAYRHGKELKPGPSYMMPLDTKHDAETVVSLENFERATSLIRAAAVDILEWYLPWHIRNLSTVAAPVPGLIITPAPTKSANP